MPGEIANKISSQVQQPVVRQPDVSAKSAVQGSMSIARVSRSEQGQETAANSGQILPPESQGKVNKEEEKESVKAAVANIEDYVQSVSRDLKFSVDDDSGRVVVKVLDSETQAVIRQIPSEEALDMARKLQEHIGEESGGLLFRDNA